MDSQTLFDSLRRELTRHGLPHRYVVRVVQELQDHQSDIHQESAELGNWACSEKGPGTDRLGDPIQLAKTLAAEFKNRTFAGRHPILTFLAAPVPLTLLTWLICAYLFALPVFWFAELEPGRGSLQWPPLFIGTMLTLYYAWIILPSALTAGLCCRWAYRSGRGTWSLAACVLIALYSGSSILDMRLSALPGQSSVGTDSLLFIALGQDVRFALAQQLIQLAVPLAIGACFLLRQYSQLRKLRFAE